MIHPSTLAVYKAVTGSGTVGAERSDAVPAGKWWQLHSVRAVAANGTVVTPLPVLQIVNPGGTTWAEFPGCSATQGTSTTCAYNWAPGLTLSAQVGTGSSIRSFAPLAEDLLLAAGWKVQTLTINMSTATTVTWSAPTLLITEYG